MTALHQKFRPTTFDQVVGQNAVVASLKKVVKDARAKTFLFTGPSGCVDGDTEYLSPTGWIKISNYVGGKVAQFNLDGTATWVDPTAYIKKECKTFFQLKTKYGIDQVLSSEHRVLYLTSKGNWGIKSAQEVVNLHQKNKHGFSGLFRATFTPNITSKLSLSDAELRLMVAFIADGHLLKAREHKSSKSDFKEKICLECETAFKPQSGVSLFCNNCRRWWGCIGLKKTRKIERLKCLLKEAGTEHVFYKKKAGYTTFYLNPPLRIKSFTDEFWGCSLEQLKIISNEVKYWDGCHKRKAPNISTCDKKTADFVQYAITSAGWRASILTQHRKGHTEYSVCGTSRIEVGLGQSQILTVSGFDGFKYCFEVPSSCLVLRRNGNIFVTGNTGKTTLSRILANSFCGGTTNPHNIIEIDAASTSAESLREIIQHSHYRAIGASPVKVFILDEAQKLSSAAWTVLLKPTEEPPQHVYWCLCTTEPTKVPATIKTRFLRYDLKLVTETDLLELLCYVIDTEKLQVSDDVIGTIAEAAGGSPRQALVYLEICAHAKTAAEAQTLMRVAGQSAETVDLARFLLKPNGRSWAEAIKLIKKLEEFEAESIRISVCNYLAAVLLNTKDDKRASQMLMLLECFSEPYNQSDRFAPLLNSVGLALGLDK